MTEPHQGLFYWLYTNAPAAWLSALVAIVTCAYMLITRKRPSRLTVRHEGSSPLIRVWPSVKGHIVIRFHGRPIESLGQVDVLIRNDGSDVIKEPSISVTLPEGSAALGVLLEPARFGTFRILDNRLVELSWPYVNSFRGHKQVIRVSLLVEGATRPVVISGHGEGWSVRHMPLASPLQMTYRVGAFALVSLVSWVAPYFLYIPLVEASFGIPRSEISWRALVASLPFLVAFILTVGFLWGQVMRPLRGYFEPRHVDHEGDAQQTVAADRPAGVGPAAEP